MAGRLRELRARNGYSQQGMAALAEVAQSTWSKWEVETPEQFASLGKLARKLGTSADYLLGITDDPTPPAKRGDWTPEAIEAVSLVNELPAAKRGAALAVLKAAVELTQAEELDALMSIEEQVNAELDARERSMLAMFEEILSSDDFEHVRRLIKIGGTLTPPERLRFLQTYGDDLSQKLFEVLDRGNSRSNG